MTAPAELARESRSFAIAHSTARSKAGSSPATSFDGVGTASSRWATSFAAGFSRGYGTSPVRVR